MVMQHTCYSEPRIDQFVKRVPTPSVHLLDPGRPPRRRLKRFGEIGRLAIDLAVAELDHCDELPGPAARVFAHPAAPPGIAVADHALDGVGRRDYPAILGADDPMGRV